MDITIQSYVKYTQNIHYKITTAMFCGLQTNTKDNAKKEVISIISIVVNIAVKMIS